MILGSRARYAVMAMVDLAARGDCGPVTLADLAQRQDIPLPYLEQIFAMLRRAGLVRSNRGPGGGYRLAEAAGGVTVAAIVSAVEESPSMTRCGKHEGSGCLAHGTSRCLTHDLWEGLEAHMYDYLQSVTLADVLARRYRAGFPAFQTIETLPSQ